MLGRTVVIANPAARSGQGADAAERVRRFFTSFGSATSSFDLLLTHSPHEATDMAAELAGTDTLIALGGDGLIHEVVNGLMRIASHRRPSLALIAMGSGNDYSRTQGTVRNDPERALAELLQGSAQACDLAVVDTGTPHQTYVVETLSFGLDAAIALDTSDRRAADTHQQGAMLFATSGLKILSKAHDGWYYRARYLNAAQHAVQLEGREIIFAIQVGPTYGGGFPITPAASVTDGLLDLCRNVDIPRIPATLALFGRARFGLHTTSRHLAFDQLTHLDIEFPKEEPPAQVDGERLEGTHHRVDVLPAALTVITPKRP